MIPDITFAVPSLDASTVAGQFQWFLYGFGYASVICSVALLIRIFRKSSGPSTFEN